MQFQVVLFFFCLLQASEFSQLETSQCVSYLQELSAIGGEPDVDVVEAHMRNSADPSKVAPLLMSFQDDPETCRYHSFLSTYYEFSYEEWFTDVQSGNLGNLACTLRHSKSWLLAMAHPLVLYAAEYLRHDEETLVKYMNLFVSHKVLPTQAELQLIMEMGLRDAARVFESFELPIDLDCNSEFIPAMDNYLNACAEVKTKPAMNWHMRGFYSPEEVTKSAVIRNMIENDRFDYHQDFLNLFKWEYDDFKKLIEGGKHDQLAILLEYCSQHLDEHPVVYKSIPIMHALYFACIDKYSENPEAQENVLNALFKYVSPTYAESSHAYNKLPWEVANTIGQKCQLLDDYSGMFDYGYVNTYIRTTMECGSQIID